jgi:tRNA/tmRNA/rRNA uracil-C5-methylase (TrmA/RlmC/RlmD family)
MQTIKPNVGDRVELTIEKLTPNGGRGLSRLNGFVIFTPFTVPGDRIRAKITKVKKSFAEAELDTVLEASKNRVEPPCPYFGDCGGCSLQMMDIKSQEKEKEKFVAEMLLRLNIDPLKTMKSLVSSPKPLRYRNRIQLHQKKNQIGFFRKESHSLIPIDDCLIADEKLTEKFKDLKEENKNRRFELALSAKNEVVIRGNKNAKNPNMLFFSQVNEVVNQKILDHLKQHLSELGLKGHMALDLYAGSGNFTRVLVDFFDQVTAVELSRFSVDLAKKKFKNVDFLCQSTESFLNKNTKKYDFILLDPPRFGLAKESLVKLLNSEASYIFYISCNTATLERDLKTLIQGYEAVEVRPFDMFPQTSHLEVCVLLKRL